MSKILPAQSWTKNTSQASKFKVCLTIGSRWRGAESLAALGPSSRPKQDAAGSEIRRRLTAPNPQSRGGFAVPGTAQTASSA